MAEVLEARENPAGYWWAPTQDLLATNPANWRYGSQLGPIATTAPGPQDDLYFRAGTSANLNCIVPSTGSTYPPPPPMDEAHADDPEPSIPSNTYAGLQLVESYAGTLDLRRSLAVGNLEVTSGKIAQNDPVAIGTYGMGGTLWATSAFSWTGGGLNADEQASPVAGYINLGPGVQAGLAAPANSGTVSLGSYLRLLRNETTQTGAKLTVEEGTYNLNRKVSIWVGPLAAMTLGAPVPKPTHSTGVITINSDEKSTDGVVKGALVIERRGSAEVKAAEPEASSLPPLVKFTGDVPKLTNRGTLTLKSNSELRFTPTAGKDGTTLLGDIGGLKQESFFNPAANPTTFVEAGCKIVCEQKTFVRIGWGGLVLTDLKGENGQPVANQPEVNISAPNATHALSIGNGGSIRRLQDRTVTLELDVTGAMYSNGTIHLYAFLDKLDSDSIVVSNRVEFGTSAKVSVRWFDATKTPIAAPARWTLITSDAPNGANDPDPINATPDLIYPDPTGGITVTLLRSDLDDKLQLRREP